MTGRRCYFELAAALLAIVFILVQGEAVVTRALIRADSVATLVLTSAIVLGALVDVGQEDGSKAGFLNRLVRLELESQNISVAGDRVGDFTAAKHAVLLQRVVVHLRVDRQGVVLASCRLIKSISLQIEVREVQGDLVVFGRQNLPNALLVRRIFFGE